MEKVFFNFSYLALKLLGSGLYSNPWNAISELVANGFDAGASDVYVYLEKKDDGHSLIEIFDNGSGMNYEDFATKYALIGRNKRNDIRDNDNTKPAGRKGIGKLATLYLSDNVNLISKKDNQETFWNINLANINDDEKPSINEIDSKNIIIKSLNEWDKIKHGFFIQMLDVNLNGLGEKTAAALSNRLSDFYILNSKTRRIWVSFCSSEEKTDFVLASKSIAYKNFYALFNNSNVVFKDFENQRLKIKTKYPELKIGYPSVKLDSNSFSVSGNRDFIGIDGKPVNKKYKLTGWIGIHTSINTEEARQNDPAFIKNKVTSPNRLRLYVRGKLAVENFLDYIKNTQAFSNYIEGEISFDILDDDDLPDIATANRQQLSEKDERVQLLKGLISPIVNKLILLRIKLGLMVKEDEEKIKNKEIENLNIAHKLEIEEKDAQIKEANKELAVKAEQVVFLSKGLRKNDIRLAEAMHTISKNSLSIKGKIKSAIKSFSNENIPTKLKKDIVGVELLNEKTLLLTKYAFKGKFNLKSKTLQLDIGVFVNQYMKTMFDSSDDLNFELSYDFDTPIIISYDVTSLGIILDNIVSNSKKANANNLTISIHQRGEYVALDFQDDGEGYDKELFSNPDDLFELGIRKSNSPGYGIGLYHIKDIVTSNKGSVYVDKDFNNGFRIVILLRGDE